MHNVQDYPVVGKLKDYGRTIHCQSEIRCVHEHVCVCMCMYIYVCVCVCVCI